MIWIHQVYAENFKRMFFCNAFLPYVTKAGLKRIQCVFMRLVEIFISQMLNFVFGIKPLFV